MTFSNFSYWYRTSAYFGITDSVALGLAQVSPEFDLEFDVEFDVEFDLGGRTLDRYRNRIDETFLTEINHKDNLPVKRIRCKIY